MSSGGLVDVCLFVERLDASQASKELSQLLAVISDCTIYSAKWPRGGYAPISEYNGRNEIHRQPHFLSHMHSVTLQPRNPYEISNLRI